MNQPLETESQRTIEPPAGAGTPETSAPSNWTEALLSLVASRVALIQLESKDVAKDAAGRMARWVAAAVCLFFTWELILAAGIAALSAATGWRWWWLAFAFAAAHLLVAIILVKTAKSTGAPAFPVTRAEFQKDREWIENLKKNRKSNG